MESAKTQAHQTSSDVLGKRAEQEITNAPNPKERPRSRIRRNRSHSEVSAMPSVAEALVRIASAVMLIALCFQAIHR